MSKARNTFNNVAVNEEPIIIWQSQINIKKCSPLLFHGSLIQMFRRQHNQTKRPEGNENDVESPVINRKNKQFGPASAKALNSPLQRSESGLKFKSANQKEVKNNKNDDSSMS